MTEEKLRSTIESRMEGPKLDFKWYPWNLDDTHGRGEFVKDLVALANTAGQGALGGEEGHIIIGVKEMAGGAYRPADVDSEDPTRLPLDEEQLQQIAQSNIEPSLDFEYRQFQVVGYPVGVVEVYGMHRPYCVAHDCGKVRQGQFYVRRGSITGIATRDELKQWFHEELAKEVEDLKTKIARLEAERTPGDWTLKHLENLPSEYVRYIPCFLLEMREKGLHTVSTDEIVTELERRFEVSFSEMTRGVGIGVYSSNATKQNLDELIINIDPGRGLWGLNEKYVPLVQRFRNEVIEERGRANWKLELLESVNAPTVRAIPCVFLAKWGQTGSLVMTSKELHERIEEKLGKRVKQASFIGIWIRMQKRHGLKSLFFKVARGKWRLNADYLDLVKQFCGH